MFSGFLYKQMNFGPFISPSSEVLSPESLLTDALEACQAHFIWTTGRVRGLTAASCLLWCPSALLNHPAALFSPRSWSCSLYFTWRQGQQNDEFLCHHSKLHHRNKCNSQAVLWLWRLYASWDSQSWGYNRWGIKQATKTVAHKVRVKCSCTWETKSRVGFFSYVIFCDTGILHEITSSQVVSLM